jgi:2'-5' RNA ligase
MDRPERRHPGYDRGREEADRPEQPRLFVAVPLADDVRASIGDLVGDVRTEIEGSKRRGEDRPVRWVRLDSLHLTLRFLGATEPARVDAVADAVREAATETRRFAITLRGSGAFPSAGRPRTLWLGVVEGREALTELAARLDDRLAERGWPADERPYRAHLTLARADGVRAGPRTAAMLHAAALDRQWSFEAERLVLFESHLGGGPARYEALAEARLGAIGEPIGA